MQVYGYLLQHHPKSLTRDQLQALFDDLKANFLVTILSFACFKS